MNIMTVVKSIDYDTGRIYVTHRELLGTWEKTPRGLHWDKPSPGCPQH